MNLKGAKKMKGCNNKLMLSIRKVKEGLSVFPFKSCTFALCVHFDFCFLVLKFPQYLLCFV
jgi:hypothetical protein